MLPATEHVVDFHHQVIAPAERTKKQVVRIGLPAFSKVATTFFLWCFWLCRIRTFFNELSSKFFLPVCAVRYYIHTPHRFRPQTRGKHDRTMPPDVVGFTPPILYFYLVCPVSIFLICY